MDDDMHSQALDKWQHGHTFLGDRHDRHQRRTLFVVVLTAAMMVAEIIGGTMYGSMALVADGWHMSTHAGALAIAAWSYYYARRHAQDARFSFGTGKLGDLAGFASAVILGLIALAIGYESCARLLNPVSIHFNEAIFIAVMGLGVNLVSAWLLHDQDHGHGHHHAHGHDHDHAHATHDAHHHRDHNLSSAYVHVLADALTSVLAIAALLSARTFGWLWMDPMMGVVGACVIAAWSWSLIRSSGAVLLDTVPDPALAETVKQRLEIRGDRIADLHLWRLGPGHLGLVASIVSDFPQAPDVYRARLAGIPTLSHVTIEVNPCRDHDPEIARHQKGDAPAD
jgi:cation diffusion facilitator family transporter